MRQALTTRRALSLVLFLFSLAVVICISGGLVMAQADPCSGANASSDYCQALTSSASGNDPITDTIRKVSLFLAFIGGFIAIFWIIIQGIKMATSHGNPEKITSSRSGIIYAATGLVLIIAAQSIILLVLKLID